MAHIDNLIESIKDPVLRAALRAEYDKVTKNRQLGLVFDRHLPETVALPGFTIRDGEKIQVLADGTDDPLNVDDTGIWTVTALDGDTAHLRDSDGNTREAPTHRLVATREFGDPIYPGLVSTGSVIRGGGAEGDDGGKPFHTVINAENYHALEALLFAYEGQVDAIYIDPPYNTGARDWKYNNDYVDDGDPYRHSKWLSFIERRLLLAKRLLNPADSVLIVTIDEKEYLRLGLLLEQTFPSARVQMVSIVINPLGQERGQQLSRVEEYAFFLFFGNAAPSPVVDDLLTVQSSASEASAGVAPAGGASPSERVRWEWLLRGGGDGVRRARPDMFYPVYINAETRTVAQVGEPIALDQDRSSVPQIDGLVQVWPLRTDGSEGRWRCSPNYFRELLNKGYAKVGAYDRKADRWSLLYLGRAQIERVQSGEIQVLGNAPDGSVLLGPAPQRQVLKSAKTVWNRNSHRAGEFGTSLLRRLLPGRSFPFAKSLYAVEDTLRVTTAHKPDALVLDFFSGSGTTAHAVMRLNKQDGGRRRSISVTNNEVSPDEQRMLRAQDLRPGDSEWEALGICEYVTKPRITSAITGRTPGGDLVRGDYKFSDEFPMAEGFAENAEFFTLTYEDPALVSLGRRFEAIAPLIWLRAGAVGERIDKVADDGWAIPAGAVYGVLFDTTMWGPFVAAAAKRDDLTHAFVVTDSLVEYQQIVAKLDPTIKTTRLYADYLRSFAINTTR